MKAFLYNYKNSGPFPPDKLNFHHKTSWPQTKKSISDHVIICDNAVPPEALLPRCRTIQVNVTISQSVEPDRLIDTITFEISEIFLLNAQRNNYFRVIIIDLQLQ